MINITKDTINETLLLDILTDIDSDISLGASCSCNNPSRMFWFTPEEIMEDLEQDTQIEIKN